MVSGHVRAASARAAPGRRPRAALDLDALVITAVRSLPTAVMPVETEPRLWMVESDWESESGSSKPNGVTARRPSISRMMRSESICLTRAFSLVSALVLMLAPPMENSNDAGKAMMLSFRSSGALTAAVGGGWFRTLKSRCLAQPRKEVKEVEV